MRSLAPSVARAALFKRGLLTFSAASFRPRHEYVILRHGRSEANELGIISSDPGTAIATHGLTDEGRQQARKAGQEFAASLTDGKTVAIFSSDFLRARETASIVHAAVPASQLGSLCAQEPVLDQRLRERWFGSFDATSTDNYDRVWALDEKATGYEAQGVESVASVAERASLAVRDIDARLGTDRSWVVLLVAHGDTLQILQACAAGMDPQRHRSLDHLDTAVLRPLFPPGEAVDTTDGVAAHCDINEAYRDYLQYYDGQLTKGWKS